MTTCRDIIELMRACQYCKRLNNCIDGFGIPKFCAGDVETIAWEMVLRGQY